MSRGEKLKKLGTILALIVASAYLVYSGFSILNTPTQ